MTLTSTPSNIQEISLLIGQQKYSEAISLVKEIISEEPGPEKYALLGLAYFRSEQYALAADAYREALRSDEANSEWKEMLENARKIPSPKLMYQFPKSIILTVKSCFSLRM